MIKRAMILAAGFGKRIHPLTLTCPKPLLKIGNSTLLSNTIKFLEVLGIKEITINVHYLADQIINYINKETFISDINIIEEKGKILNTGGGILNAIKNFSNEPFLVINPDTIWGLNYLQEVKLMERSFFKNSTNKCLLLLVNKKKSFDQSIKGDFNLKNNLISQNSNDNFKYIYTGLQILKPEVFANIKYEAFSLNQIWNSLIKNEELTGFESFIDFKHISTFQIYEKLKKNNFVS
jgi:N-acetyl-alpha-D-muramate 1-phosphate uridylyltransferase